MNKPYSFKAGYVTKYSTNQKKHIHKIHIYQIMYLLIFICCMLITHYIFKQCICEPQKLSETISLGSIFATFGSSIVAVFSITMSNYYERFCTNIEILYSNICPDCKWYRWPFIKRESHNVLFNKELTYQILKNATFTFNVGSHEITIDLPTVREDFYDLQNWKFFITMKKEYKHYESYILKNIKEPAEALMIWDCILDNYRSIAIYKIAKLFIVVGESFILSSILFAFFYDKIPF